MVSGPAICSPVARLFVAKTMEPSRLHVAPRGNPLSPSSTTKIAGPPVTGAFINGPLPDEYPTHCPSGEKNGAMSAASRAMTRVSRSRIARRNQSAVRSDPREVRPTRCNGDVTTVSRRDERVLRWSVHNEAGHAGRRLRSLPERHDSRGDQQHQQQRHSDGCPAPRVRRHGRVHEPPGPLCRQHIVDDDKRGGHVADATTPVLLEAASEQRTDRRREVRRQHGPVDIAVTDSSDRVADVVALKRPRSGQHLVQNAAE